jgi:hypothetical protein
VDEIKVDVMGRTRRINENYEIIIQKFSRKPEEKISLWRPRCMWEE